MRIVGLPWYELPSTRQRLRVFWPILRDALHDEGVDRLPSDLDRSTSLEAQWSHPGLLISQCCGLDLFTRAGRSLSPIGRMVFDDLPCEPGHYFSHIVATPGLGRPPTRTAINSASSRSGCTALLRWMRDRGWGPKEILISGSHQTSLDWVRRGRADLASIDAHTWRLIDRAGVEVVGRSAESPAPLFVHQGGGDVPRPVLMRALENAIARGGSMMGVRGIIASDRELYRPMAEEAIRLGVTGIDASGSPSSAAPVAPFSTVGVSNRILATAGSESSA